MSAMNVASERAREACVTCRQSHKKCTYDGNSTRCVRCERRNTQCSLFHPNVGPSASVAYESTPGAWAGTPGHGPASPNSPHQAPPQEQHHLHVPTFTGNAQPATIIFQSSTNPHEHLAMNQDFGLYNGYPNVFGDHNGA